MDSIIVFDGGQYKFAAMQTPCGRNLLLEGGAGYTDTDAIVRILRSVGSGWSVVAALLSIVPRFIRNPLYRWVARRRYRLFGRRESCVVPTADVADRFLR